MPTAIYIHHDDKHVQDIVFNALKTNGYDPKYFTENNVSGDGRNAKSLTICCAPTPSPNRLTFGDLTVDFDAICVYDATGQPIHFTPIEFSMLSYLIQNAHRAVPRSELLPAIWKIEHGGKSRVADDTAKRLRRKLKATSLSLETVWNYGFRICTK